jgi:hypothetical protein
MTDIENRARSPSYSPPNTPPFPPILTTPAINDPLEFHAHFVPYGPGAWAPYQPLTLDCYSPKPSSPQTTDQLFKRQQLPFNLLVLNERDRMAISVGFEQRGILLAQAEIVQRRQRQQLAIHRIRELEIEKQEMELQEQIRQTERTLDIAVIEALQRVLIYFPPDPPDPVVQTHDIPLDMPGKIDFNKKYWLSLISFRVDGWVNRMLGMAL